MSSVTLIASLAGLIDQPERHAPVLDRLADELARVETRFERQLEIELPPVERLCRHIEHYRGKMLRPVMTLLSGIAAAYSDPTITSPRPAHDGIPTLNENHRVLAAVCEMIHMATLVHDDVLDEADMRRQGATVNYLHGNEAAVLLGDYLISNAFHLCSTLNRPDLNECIGRVTNSMCAGELLQLHHREDWSIDTQTYLEIIDRKTASLIGLCCELGARESGANNERCNAMRDYGRLLGLAFQIQDDLLDVVGDEPTVGKSLGRDLQKRKLTLPVILYFRNARPRDREDMLALLDPDVDAAQAEAEVRERLESSDSVRLTQEKSAEFVAEAHRQLHHLVESPARALLDDLALAVIARTY